MILEYLRPGTIEEAVAYLTRPNPVTIPLGGGTTISRQNPENFAVVDLQGLGLNHITQDGNILRLGAMVTLQQLVESEGIPEVFRKAAQREVSLNVRQMATIGGTIVAGPGYSPLVACLLAADSSLVWEPNPEIIALGDWLPLRRSRSKGMIREIQVPVNHSLSFDTIGRSPADRPMLTVALSRWPSGRVRIAAGANDQPPALLMDGDGSGLRVEDIDIAIKNAHSQLINPWFSIEYQQHAARTMLMRMLGEE